MLPLLKLAGDKNEHSARDAIDTLAATFKLTDDEKRQLLPSGKIGVFYDRVHWALSYLKHSGLVLGTRRGYFRITDRGLDVLKENPIKIDAKYLRRFPEFLDYIGASKDEKEPPKISVEASSDRTPEEMLETGYQAITQNLAKELLEQVKGNSPKFFEDLVLDLMESMEYGLSGTIVKTGKTGDEGIDGIIYEDKLHLDGIYVQAKKWDSTVGRPKIQEFVGALDMKKSDKGVFITTGTFSSEAVDFAERSSKKIELIDGDRLANLMIEHNVGVKIRKKRDVKELDLDYFEGQP